ncbi:MATE family efflux transporter [Natronomonas salsuginis]|uniref:Multidrug-efflux transporter n=1 Tax=Natronomonas salsuginis TaxID=2217661 RepID=A0A4U5J8Q6_9EURY|nr:MATE family efflux transporter [Natronomonas salsuginis]TKR24476.1 MATE family efflux transporter [Natronomonas salsuginis]
MVDISEQKETWERVVQLGWPITLEQLLNTLMRTIDVIVTGLFSPVAVAAVGLADLYAQIPLRVGLGLGTASIAISSQDTGRGAVTTRDRVVTQAMLIGALCGIPFTIIGLLFSNSFIELLGAESEVVLLGGTYLMIVLSAASMRIISIVGARSLQGAGDTRTPLLVNGSANIVNIVVTVLLGLGLLGFPSLGIVGVGIGTFVGRTTEMIFIVGLFVSNYGPLSFDRQFNYTITKQIVLLSVPNFFEGMSTSLANFPFNALLLLFGTEANAAYHIGRRIFQQVTGPISRSLSTVSSIIIGQTLGEGRPEVAQKKLRHIISFSVAVLFAVGIILFVVAEPLIPRFTSDPTTAGYAITFTWLFSISTVLFGTFFTLAGALRGAGDTRTPLYARLTGVITCMLGMSYLLGILLDYGLPGIYVGIFLTYVIWVIIAYLGIRYGGWLQKAESLISEREQI